MPARRVQSVVIAIGDRLVGAIAAGHHQRECRRARAGAGDATECRAASRRDMGFRARPTGRRRGPDWRRSRTIGPRAWTRAARPRRGETSAISRAARDVGHHDGERLLISVLSACATRPHARSIAGRAGEMVAAQTFDGGDFPWSNASAARAIGSSHGDRPWPPRSRSRSCGPQPGQAVG